MEKREPSGRDDESDLTGRIWRVKYTGKDRPTVTHKLDAAEWSSDDGVKLVSAAMAGS